MPERRDLISDQQARDLLSEIPSASSDPNKGSSKRNRDYERKHRAFTYRLTDTEIGGKIAAIADSLFVPVEDVARAFIEVGMQAAHQDKIPFAEIPFSARRLTLYPTGNETWEIREGAGWGKEIPARRKKRKLSEVERKQRQKELNKFCVSYRWPASVDERLTRLVENLFGAVTARSEGRKGWLLTILLRYSLNAYHRGDLPLEPKASIMNQRLRW